jgi:hypothetical protein
MLGPDDKSAILLRNVGKYPPKDKASHLQTTELQQHLCDHIAFQQFPRQAMKTSGKPNIIKQKQ